MPLLQHTAILATQFTSPIVPKTFLDYKVVFWGSGYCPCLTLDDYAYATMRYVAAGFPAAAYLVRGKAETLLRTIGIRANAQPCVPTKTTL